MVPESDNPHDSEAVRIEIQDQTVGYLDRETARSFWDRGDGDRGHFGVKLDLPTA